MIMFVLAWMGETVALAMLGCGCLFVPDVVVVVMPR